MKLCNSFNSLGQLKKGISGLLLFLPVIIFGGCSDTVVFQSDFQSTPTGQPPGVQKVGTISLLNPGNVKVIEPPVEPSDKWIQIVGPSDISYVTGAQCNFSRSYTGGTYNFTAYFFLPSNSGVATVQFVSFAQSISDFSGFLHIDFMEDNTIRIDDIAATVFGTFPRDKVFVLSVILKPDGSQVKAKISLSGNEASGSKDYTILTPFLGAALNFGGVRFWKPFPSPGVYDVTNIVITRK